MGAIFAILGEAGDPELGDRLQRMLARSPHRGAQEFLVEGPLAIGIQSLGLDASLADVGNWLVAFHGYIGNWSELAAERGWRFEDGASNADKIAVAFEDVGERLFAKLRGEWALLVWDRTERNLLAARDVVGCRPLFSHRGGDRLYLATEIRQVLAGSGAEAGCNAAAAADLHLVRFPEAGRTVFQGVERVPGGVARSFRPPVSGLATNDVEFWGPPPVDRARRDPRDLVAEVRSLIDTAVKRSAPETGAAVSLSGGMDSSSVWGTLVSLVDAAELRAGTFRPYSNVYPGLDCDETPFIRSILEFTGADGALVDTSAVKASEYLDALCDRIDHPHMPNALPVELVCAAAAADRHNVLLTGLGGDEWLGGSLDYVRELFYSRRIFTALRDLWTVRLPVRLGSARQRAGWLLPGIGLAARLGAGRGRNQPGPREAVICPKHRRNDPAVQGSWVERLQNRDLSRTKKVLVSCLDHMASGAIFDFIEQQGAWHGLDIRHPFMDLDIIEFGFSVEPRALVAGHCHKWLVRQAMADRLPPAVAERIETTVFTEIFRREADVLQKLPPPEDWILTRLGVVDVDALKIILTKTSSERTAFELIRLWWLESFVVRNFTSEI